MARIKWRRCRGWCLSSFDELWNTCDLHHKFRLNFPFIVSLLVFFLVHFTIKKKKTVLQDCFCVGLYCPIFAAGIHVLVGLNTNQMEEGKQYSEYSVERNPRAYMSMRD